MLYLITGIVIGVVLTLAIEALLFCIGARNLNHRGEEE